MPVSTPKYKNLFCQTLKKQVLIRGFLLLSNKLLSPKSSSWSSVALVHVELVSPVFVVPDSAKQFSLSLERVTTMPVCLTSSFTFNASARLVENFTIIRTLIPPPLCQHPLGSSNGGPQTLLKVKSIHEFCFPCFS